MYTSDRVRAASSTSTAGSISPRSWPARSSGARSARTCDSYRIGPVAAVQPSIIWRVSSGSASTN
jgi:hypothetical protein